VVQGDILKTAQYFIGEQNINKSFIVFTKQHFGLLDRNGSIKLSIFSTMKNYISKFLNKE
jgi:hypothetical protein